MKFNLFIYISCLLVLSCTLFLYAYGGAELLDVVIALEVTISINILTFFS